MNLGGGGGISRRGQTTSLDPGVMEGGTDSHGWQKPDVHSSRVDDLRDREWTHKPGGQGNCDLFLQCQKDWRLIPADTLKGREPSR